MDERSPEQVATNWDRSAPGYAAVASRFTAKFAREAVELAGVGVGTRVLDVAAGTGVVSLEAARRGADVLATDFSPGMLAELDQQAAREGLTRVRTAVMDGQRLELDDASFERAFSMFGLMFFPELARGFAELHRVLIPGGRATVGVWRGLEHHEIMQLMIGAMKRVVPDFSGPPRAPAWTVIATADGMRAALRAAGFARVDTFTVRNLWVLDSPEAFWERLPRTAPGFDALFQLLDADQVTAFGQAVRDILRERHGDGPYALAGDALLGVGIKGDEPPR